jgi:hypothetical protein
MKTLDAKGMGMVELLIGVLIFTLLAESVVMMRLVVARKTVRQADQNYASLKGLQMTNELEAQANGNPFYGGAVLDGFNDGVSFNLNLTTDKSVNDPGDPLSGNRQTNGHWHYLRQVQVSPVDGNIWARQVVVKVWICASDGNSPSPGLLLATVSGMIIPGTALSKGITLLSGGTTTLMNQ